MKNIDGFNKKYSGLSYSEVILSQERHGKNQLSTNQQFTFIFKILHFFKEPMFLLLIGTALIYFILGEISDGVTMLVFVFFMAGITLFQEWRTDKTLQALKSLASPRVKVIRNNGELETIESYDLTIDDLMVLEEGDKVAADGQILEMYDFGVNESTLTGESDIVWKKATENLEFQHWRQDYCYAGTAVTQGRAIVKVLQIGANTEYGKIGLDLLSVPQQGLTREFGNYRTLR